MVRLFFLIGLPGSGKSTIAHALISQCPDCALISTDRIRLDRYGDEAIQGDWLQVWQDVERGFREAASRIQQGKQSAAVYDATNSVRKQRQDAIALARKSGFTQITGIWVSTPLWLCLQRNQQRDRQVPEDVIQRMSRRLRSAPPSKLEGFNELIRVQNKSLQL